MEEQDEDKRVEELVEDKRLQQLVDRRVKELDEDRRLRQMEDRRVKELDEHRRGEAVVDVSEREQEERALKEVMEESTLAHLREDTDRVLRMLKDQGGPPQQWGQVYAYVEAHLHDPDRVQIVAAEFMGMVENIPKAVGMAESRLEEVASPQARQPSLDPPEVTKGKSKGKGKGKGKGAQRKERQGEVEEDGEGASNSLATLAPSTSRHNPPSTCAPAPGPVNLGASSSRPVQRAAAETSVADKRPPPAAAVGMERRSSRTGRGRRYLEFMEDIHSTKKKPKAAEPEQEDKTVTEQEDKTVTEEGEVTAKKKRRRSGCGTCEGCSAEDCQVCRHLSQLSWPPLKSLPPGV